MALRMLLLIVLLDLSVVAAAAADSTTDFSETDVEAGSSLAFPNTLRGSTGVYEYLLAIAENQNAGAPLKLHVDEIGLSQKGVPICMFTINAAYRGPDAGDGGLMVIARQHGDEPAGTHAMVELIQMIASEPDGDLIEAVYRTTLRIIPIANPDGMDAFQRRTAGGIDMNRDWNSHRLSETRAIASVIDKFRPDVLLDLHEMTPRDGGQFHMVGLPRGKASGMLWAAKQELKAHGLPARTLPRESSNSTSLLHRNFAATYGRVALLVESKYISEPTVDMDRRSRYHITVVLAALKELSRRPDSDSRTQILQIPLSTASATRRN